jgi:uncharacterized spore protein YtfJ
MRRATVDASEILNHARDAMTVKRVFGDPYEKDGVTVIPVANVMGGVGAGGGSSAGARPPSTSHETAGESAGDSGYGMGYGLRATPAGVYVIRGGEVEWQPALDQNRLTLQRALVVIVALLVLRSMTKTLVRR